MISVSPNPTLAFSSLVESRRELAEFVRDPAVVAFGVDKCPNSSES